MYNISSQLASQTINKNTVWKCLVSLGKVSGELNPEIANRMIVEAWAVGVRVVIKRSGSSKGLSTIISVFNMACAMSAETERKSHGLNVIRKSERLFLVDSFQDPSHKHVITAQADGLTLLKQLVKLPHLMV
jgi:hypothetical protein